ncbi:mpv17-like protein 2 [Drosophila sechellia]|uniref:GM24695 n=2 Tax=melanogaster subgroup TaxID=32351 RepID=B4HF12_DROSE|nr:mpv17-like protein 2 [Drosophila sechellia]XP_033157175.1 mpv17-like protein 2 [Drosophila mauritiana]EDW41181.1 GM24695 [Drosophila sechellia]
MALRVLWKRMTNAMDRFHQVAFSPKYLLYTNIGISVGLSMVGDTMEQSYERLIGELPDWNRTRTVRMGISGLTVGLVCHYWYQHLDYLFPKRTYKVVVVKILLDQFICSPFYIAVFFLTMAILEDNTWEELEQEIREKALVLYAAEWTVWPLAQFINFLLIKPQYRVFYDNTISLGYDVYTSQVKYRKKPEPKDNS